MPLKMPPLTVSIHSHLLEALSPTPGWLVNKDWVPLTGFFIVTACHPLFLIFLFLLFFLFLIRVAPAGLEKGQSLFQVPIGMGPPCNSNNFYKTYTVSISSYKSTSNKPTTPLGDVASIIV